MFARRVSLRLKPNAVKDFTKKMVSDVIPLLRKQKGFQDEITFTAKDGRKALGISLWDGQKSAEAYERDSYPQVQKMLDQVVEGSPRVETYELSTSTFHKTLAPAKT